MLSKVFRLIPKSPHTPHKRNVKLYTPQGGIKKKRNIKYAATAQIYLNAHNLFLYP